jgi:IS30 family transposase
VRNRLIHWCWSAELVSVQIAARLQCMHPDCPSQRVRHETLCTAICAQPRGGLKTLMIEALRQAKPKRGARRTSLAGFSMVPEALDIIHRPENFEARLVPGHWEGDLVKGAFNRSAVGTVAERKARFVILSKMQGCTASVGP